MKNLFVVFFLLVCFFAFSETAGEVLFDECKYFEVNFPVEFLILRALANEYLTEDIQVYFIDNGEKIIFKIFHYNKNTNLVWSRTVNVDPSEYKQIMKNKKYKIILTVWENPELEVTDQLKIMAFIKIIYSKEKNKYKKVNNFDNIELNKRI
ncbi:MAG TPA: hypothetical protein VGB37_16280 [Candidatus Lokiarchaeia archaeon]